MKNQIQNSKIGENKCLNANLAYLKFMANAEIYIEEIHGLE